MNPDAAPNLPSSVPRLSPEAQLSLREVSAHLGERGHAIIWATNYEARNGSLPTCSQIVSGLDRDLGILISASSAERALRKIREQTAQRTE